MALCQRQHLRASRLCILECVISYPSQSSNGGLNLRSFPRCTLRTTRNIARPGCNKMLGRGAGHAKLHRAFANSIATACRDVRRLAVSGSGGVGGREVCIQAGPCGKSPEAPSSWFYATAANRPIRAALCCAELLSICIIQSAHSRTRAMDFKPFLVVTHRTSGVHCIVPMFGSQIAEATQPVSLSMFTAVHAIRSRHSQ